MYFRSLPPVRPDQWAVMRAALPPRNLAAVVAFRDTVLEYGGGNKLRVGVALGLTYVTMQTFAIPGSVSLSLVMGALYGRWLGFVLTALISTAGSSSCYLLSWAIGKPLVGSLWPERLAYFQHEVRSRRGRLLRYMLFLRLTPLLPNVFINLAAPIVGVPLHTFALATLVGCAPNNFVASNAGAHLGELTSLQDLMDPRLLGLGAAAGVIGLASIFWQDKMGAPPPPKK